MELSDQQYERIQRYLDNQMTGSEKQAFLQEAETDPGLKQGLELETNLRNYLLAKNAIDEAGKSWKPAPRMRISYLRIAIAASIILAVATTVFFLNPDKTPPPPTAGNDTLKNGREDIVKTPPQKDVIDTTTGVEPEKKGTDVAQKPEEKKGTKINGTDICEQYYVKENAPESLGKPGEEFNNNRHEEIQSLDLDAVTSKDPDDKDPLMDLYRFYRGISFFETKNYAKARQDFQRLISTASDNVVKQKSQWYLALLYLRENRFSEATGLLTPLANNSNAPYHEKAKTLLQTINQQ